ncbi:hypothetical protein IFM89_024773 [Coptis chinensis]|uniref:Pentatricopeptide repeat-containing protein n=1 Tax=Coptis chinensis TaxID=261450 RepID=A0A835HNC8_9MAGN|nr:hypothetical protein IFM89_024773 [Coptis chinensis]
MNRAKGILASLRLMNSFHLTRSLNTQKSYFSSTPSSVVELFRTREWSEELKQELEKAHLSTLSHETVLYVLMKLDQEPLKALDFFTWETINEFWCLVKRMSDEDCDIDEDTYSTVLGNFKAAKMINDANALNEYFTKVTRDSASNAIVKSVAEVVLESDCDDNVKKKLWELKVTLSESIVLRILRALGQCPLKALCVFRWMEEDMGYSHSAITYNGVLRVLGRQESVNEFWSVVKEMESAGYDIDMFAYRRLSKNFRRNKMIKTAVELYEVMMDSPNKPSLESCRILLWMISLDKNTDIDLAFRVFKKYEATGYALSKAVYDGIHRCLTNAGRFNEAEMILETMKTAGHEPDNITYSQVLNGLCTSERMEEAYKLLDEMEAQGCIPDLKTWTILIQGHCNARDIDQAMKCFTKMLEKKVDVDADVLEVLVNGLCGQGRVDGANNLVIEMVDKANMRPLVATYKNLIQILLRERKIKEATNLLCLMKKHNFQTSLRPFYYFISRTGTVDDASEFLEILSTKQYPSSAAYYLLLKSFLKEGRQSEAQDLRSRSPAHISNHADIGKLFASA